MAHSSVTSTRATIARGAYLLVILVATLTNLAFEPEMAEFHARLIRALELTMHMNDVVDGARNLLLFAGLGAVWIATTRTSEPMRVVLRVTIIGFLLSFGVEVMQLFSALRRASILDVVTDTTGTLAGALGALGALTAVRSRVEKPSYVGIPAFIFAISYGAAAMMEAFLPLLRENLLPNLGGGVGERIGRAWAAFDPNSITQLSITDFVIFFPAGVFAVAAAAELGVPYSRAWPVVALVGSVIVVLIEIVHSVAMAPIILGAMLVHAVAVTTGALVAAFTLHAYATRLDDHERPRLLAAAYALVIITWSWRPFRLEVNGGAMGSQFSVEHLIPLRALAGRMDLFSVTDVIAQCLLFLPLGALLAVWPLRRSGLLRGLLPALYLSVVLEVGKIVVASRFMDVTHILIQSAGAAIGWLIVHRAGFVQYGDLLDREPARPTGEGRAGLASRLDEQSIAEAHPVAGHIIPRPELSGSSAEPGSDSR